MKDVPDVITLVGGTHVISVPFAINHGLVIVQGTAGTVVQIADGTAEGNYGAFAITNFDNITIRDLEIDGNKAGQGAYVNTPGLVEPAGVTGFTAHNCTIYDSKGDGVEPVGCEDVAVTSCYVHDCYQHAVHFNGVTNGEIADCHLADDGSLLITGGHGGINGLIIRNNTIERPGGTAPALGISANDAPAGMRQDCQVYGNTFNLNGSKGIEIAEDFDVCEITGNTFVDAPAIIITVGAGATNIDIHDNVGCDAGNIEWL